MCRAGRRAPVQLPLHVPPAEARPGQGLGPPGATENGLYVPHARGSAIIAAMYALDWRSRTVVSDSRGMGVGRSGDAGPFCREKADKGVRLGDADSCARASTACAAEMASTRQRVAQRALERVIWRRDSWRLSAGGEEPSQRICHLHERSDQERLEVALRLVGERLVLDAGLR